MLARATRHGAVANVERGAGLVTWKATERAIAKYLGGERVSKFGLGSDVPDVETEWCSAEVKHRKALPSWLKGAMAQAVANASADMLPLVVLHEHGKRHDDDLVMLRLEDFQEWFGGWPGEEG